MICKRSQIIRQKSSREEALISIYSYIVIGRATSSTNHFYPRYRDKHVKFLWMWIAKKKNFKVKVARESNIDCVSNRKQLSGTKNL